MLIDARKLEYVDMYFKDGFILQNNECPVPPSKYRDTPVICAIIFPSESLMITTCPFFENTEKINTCICHYEDFQPVTINIPG